MLYVCVQTLVSCNGPNIIATDERVSTEEQDHLHAVADDRTQLGVSSVHHQLLRKNEQLNCLRCMLKEVCTILHVYFNLALLSSHVVS